MISLQATVRETFGTGASRRARRANLVPAVVYAKGRSKTMHLLLEHHVILKHVDHANFHQDTLEVQVEGQDKPLKLNVKAVERHPFKPKVLHIDFVRA